MWQKLIKTFLHIVVAASFASCAIKKSSSRLYSHDGETIVDFVPCGPSTPKDTTCSIQPLSVHPMQFALGFKDVAKKRETIKTFKDKPRELDDFLRKKIIPSIKGPEDVFYILDGHHTTRALAEESVMFMYLKVEKDLSNLSKNKFLETVTKEGLVWLYNENGDGPQDPEKLPSQITELKDDPYRSLAEDAQDEGAYEEKPVYFQQFIWANYFRLHIEKSLVTSNYKKALEQALQWAKHSDASGLPGFKG